MRPCLAKEGIVDEMSTAHPLNITELALYDTETELVTVKLRNEYIITSSLQQK